MSLRNLTVFFLLGITQILSAQKKYEYPVVPKDSTVNQYFDTLIADPYQWMENPNDPRLRDWLQKQNAFTQKLSRQQTNKRLLDAKIGSIYWDTREEETEAYKRLKKKKETDKYQFDYKYSEYDRSPDFVYKKGNETNWKYLLRIKDIQQAKNEVIDVARYWENEEENLIAVAISRNGSDWREVYIFNLLTGKLLEEKLLWLRSSSNIVWTGRSFFYDRYHKPEEGREFLDLAKGQSLYLHEINSSQTEDQLVYLNPDQSGSNQFRITGANDDLVLLDHFGFRGGKTYRALSYISGVATSDFEVKSFLMYPNSDDVNFSVEEVINGSAIMRTNMGSPNGKVVVANINELNQLGELVPQYDATLREVNQIDKDKIACIYRKDGQYMVLIYNLKAELLKKIDIPQGKLVNNLHEHEFNDRYTLFSISSFFHPPLWYKLDLNTLDFTPIEEISVPYKVDDLETRYVKFKSKDGTEVPMFITCNKNTKLNGKNPTLLYGYGGYGITVEPGYEEEKALFLAYGGVLAIPNIRGGGGEGDEWAKAGRGLKKQNAINDFLAAAEYLIQTGYTSSEKLAINGGSHGGMLVTAAMTQRPELFKAVIAEAGVYDMLRFEKFTIGGTSTSFFEFGDTSNEQSFKNLLSYSPLHNIKEGVKYPNLLLLTGETDDRVPPLHTYKFLASLQEKADSETLFHAYITPNTGHGEAITVEEFVDQSVFKYYFLFEELGIKIK